MRFIKLAFLATLLFYLSHCNAYPVKGKSETDSSGQIPSMAEKSARQELKREIDRLGINKESTIDDLDAKVASLLRTKYQNNHTACSIAVNYLGQIGVDKDTIGRYRYRRILESSRKSEIRYRSKPENRINAKTKKKQSAALQGKALMGSRERGSKKQALLCQEAKRLERIALEKKLEEEGLQDETDPFVFLKVENDMKGNLSKLKYGQLLAEIMKAKTGDAEWYTRFKRARVATGKSAINKRYRNKLAGKMDGQAKSVDAASSSADVTESSLYSSGQEEEPRISESRQSTAPFDDNIALVVVPDTKESTSSSPASSDEVQRYLSSLSRPSRYTQSRRRGQQVAQLRPITGTKKCKGAQPTSSEVVGSSQHEHISVGAKSPTSNGGHSVASPTLSRETSTAPHPHVSQLKFK